MNTCIWPLLFLIVDDNNNQSFIILSNIEVFQMAEYVSLYTSSIHRRSLTDIYNQFKEDYQGEEKLNLLYRYPANMHIIGELHRHNTDFGFKEILQIYKEVGCPCCKTQYRTYEKDLHLSKIHMTPTLPQISKMNNGEMCYKIGSEVVAFFTQIKILIVSLLIRFIILDLSLFVKAYFYSNKLYSRVQLTKNGHLVDQGYILDEQLSLSSKIIVAYYKYDIVGYQLLGLIITMIFFFVLSQKYQLSIFQAIENAVPNQNRYTILVENIPLIPVVAGYEQARFQDMSYEKRLQIYFKRYIKEHLLSKLKNYIENSQLSKQGLSRQQKQFLQILHNNKQTNAHKIQQQIVQQVLICYQNSCLVRLQKQKQYLMSRFLNLNTESKLQKEQDKQFTINALKKINQSHLKIVNNFNTTNTLTYKLPYFLGFAFVVFKYQTYRDFLIKESVQYKSSLKMNDTNILVIRAAEKPSVIEWNHFVQRKQQQLKTRVYTNSILILVLMITLVILSYLQMYKIIPMIQKWLNFPKRYQHRIKVIIISCITSLINLLLSSIIQILAESQKRLSKTGTFISLLTKNVITQFFNSALIYYIITFVTPANFLFVQKDLKQKIQSLIIIPGIIRIAVSFINAKYIYKKFQFQFYSSNNFQIQFNKLYERPEFDFVNKYTYYIVQVLTVSFYAPLTPMIIPALIVILPIFYYVDKLILFKKSSQPPKVSFRVTDWVHFLIQCSLLTFTIGWILFCPQDLWTDFVEIISYLCFIIVVIYLAYRLKMVTQFEEYYCEMKKSSKSYNQCEKKILQKFRDYDPWKCYFKPSNSPVINVRKQQVIH